MDERDAIVTSIREQAIETVAHAVQYWLDNDESGDLANAGRVAVDALAAAGLLRDNQPETEVVMPRWPAPAATGIVVQRAPRGGEDKTSEAALRAAERAMNHADWHDVRDRAVAYRCLGAARRAVSSGIPPVAPREQEETT